MRCRQYMLKHKEHSKAFDILRFFGGYSYTKNSKWAITAGLILQFQLNRNNTNVDVYSDHRWRCVITSENQNIRIRRPIQTSTDEDSLPD